MDGVDFGIDGLHVIWREDALGLKHPSAEGFACRAALNATERKISLRNRMDFASKPAFQTGDENYCANPTELPRLSQGFSVQAACVTERLVD